MTAGFYGVSVETIGVQKTSDGWSKELDRMSCGVHSCKIVHAVCVLRRH